ncbi:MAG: DUF177 domain-containing protein [Clostridiales bacterium]|nr:DUF177 domain-containing protein [Clostridiales bacterium]
MIINLRNIFEIENEKRDLHYSIPIDELMEIRGYEFKSPIEVDGVIKNLSGIVTLQFSVEFTLKILCDRCIKEFFRDYFYEFEHIIVKRLNTDGDEYDYIVADGESINLNEIAISDLLLQLPMKMLCNEQCKGLCYVCGCDLNECVCSCSKE